MKVSELKTVVGALQSFATVRDKNEGVDTRLGIQAGAGRLKFITGDGTSGIVVDVQETEERASFYTDFRPFAQGVKVLPAKSEVVLSVSQDGLAIRAAAGGELLLKNKGPLYDAGFAKKPHDSDALHFIEDGIELNRLAKLFSAVTKGEERLSQIVATLRMDETGIHWSFVEPRVKTKYASYNQRSTHMGNRLLLLDAGFIDALKAVGKDCDVAVGYESLIVDDGHNVIYTSNVGNMESCPVLAVQGDLINFTMERKKLIDLLKGQIPHDEYGRVVMSWGKDTLEIRPFGDEDGMTIPVKTIGTGTRGVNANLMIDMLNSMDDSKVVSVRIAQGSPAIILSAEEYKDWTLLVAPLVR
jgi:hypothetical protein